MLGLMGLLGALMAGVVADSMMSAGHRRTDDDDDTFADPAEPDVMEMIGAASEGTLSPDDPDYRPVSSDVAPAPDADQHLAADADGGILSGGGGHDALTGGAGQDQLTGRAGDDAITAGGASDIVFGGLGDDDVTGGDGGDALHGEDGADLLDGGAGDDALSGDDGADDLRGGAGADSLQAGAGEDDLWGGDDDDWLAGGWGDDALSGGAGSDTLDGGAGQDTLTGLDAAVDYLNGGDGHDVLQLGAGDYGTGQAGADQFALADYGPGALPAQIADYDGSEDEIVVMYDPLVHPDPAVTTEAIDGSDDVSVLLDGVAVAVVQGGAGLLAAEIRLMAA